MRCCGIVSGPFCGLDGPRCTPVAASRASCTGAAFSPSAISRRDATASSQWPGHSTGPGKRQGRMGIEEVARQAVGSSRQRRVISPAEECGEFFKQDRPFENKAEEFEIEKQKLGGDELDGSNRFLGNGQKGPFNLDCQHFGRCSGCALATHLDRPPVLADARSFFAKWGIESFRLITGEVSAWRCRAKLAVRGSSHAVRLGLYEQGTHSVVDIPACTAHHPALNATTELLRGAMRRLGIEPYDEETGSGSLRYIQMVLTTHNTALPTSERYMQGKVQLTLVWNSRDEKAADAHGLLPLAQEVWRTGGPRSRTPVLHSVWANFQTTHTNVILGGRWRHLLGEQPLWERILGVDVAFTPASFGQANYRAFGVLLARLHRGVPPGSSVTELYAGAGVIGLTLAASRRCRRVRCVEVNKGCEAPFQLSLQRLAPSVAATLSWHCADANLAPLRWLEGADVVIVDPPRKGLDAPVVDALRRASFLGQGKPGPAPAKPSTKTEKRPWKLRAEAELVSSPGPPPERSADSWPHTLLYVSCGWEAFKQDCVALTEGNAWHLAEAEAVQFFPGTDSMEVLATFKRGSQPTKKLNRSAVKKRRKH